MTVELRKRPKAGRAVGSVWSKEKPGLLRSHRGWFVAYRGRRRVALEPTIERLLAALDEKLGTPRKPCELHRVVARPESRRGPSPRVRRPAHARP
jgi:hypothetical protein